MMVVLDYEDDGLMIHLATRWCVESKRKKENEKEDEKEVIENESDMEIRFKKVIFWENLHLCPI